MTPRSDFAPVHSGTVHAFRSVRMAGARHFSELICWQLADQIRIAIYPLTKRAAFVRDVRLRAQTEDAIESVCRNIAEGFSGSDAEFHQFLTYAKRSLNELFDSRRSAELKGHVRSCDVIDIRTYGRRLYPALEGLMRHLARKRRRNQTKRDDAAGSRKRSNQGGGGRHPRQTG
jgi:four helix bundle protein